MGQLASAAIANKNNAPRERDRHAEMRHPQTLVTPKTSLLYRGQYASPGDLSWTPHSTSPRPTQRPPPAGGTVSVGLHRVGRNTEERFANYRWTAHEVECSFVVARLLMVVKTTITQLCS